MTYTTGINVDKCRHQTKLVEYGITKMLENLPPLQLNIPAKEIASLAQSPN